MSHRMGFLRPAYDGDVVIWDSHPLSLGATPRQVFIDGIAQLSNPRVLSKPESMQLEPKVPDWDKEAKKALDWDGLPPLAIPKDKRKFGRVAFVNVRDVLQKDEAGRIEVLELPNDSNLSVVIVQGGKIICAGSESCVPLLASIPKNDAVDLEGGSIVPGLVTYGGQIGLVEIEQEPTTNDGVLPDMAQGEASAFLADVTVRAVDGLSFGGRDTLCVGSFPSPVLLSRLMFWELTLADRNIDRLAYRSGVTSSIVSPVSSAVMGGLSTAFYTGAALKTDDGAVIQPIASLHASIGSKGGTLSVSSQIAALRKALKGNGPEGESAAWWKRAAEGSIPLVVDVKKADHIATLLQLKVRRSVYKFSSLQVANLCSLLSRRSVGNRCSHRQEPSTCPRWRARGAFPRQRARSRRGRGDLHTVASVSFRLGRSSHPPGPPSHRPKFDRGAERCECHTRVGCRSQLDSKEYTAGSGLGE